MMLTTVAVMSPLCILTPYLTSAWATLAVFSIVAIACLSWLFTISVAVAEAFPVKNVASVLGIAGGFGALGAVLFNYFTTTRRKDIFNRVKLQGLDPAKKYRLKEINLFPGTKSSQPDNDKVLSGDYLMNIGLNLAPGRANAMSSIVFELVAK